MDYETRTVSVVVAPPGQPIYSEMATTVSIVDEAGGEYVEVAQEGRSDISKIAISPEDWPALRAVIDRMIGECR